MWKDSTFNSDVAVSLEVVVGSFPGVPVVPEKSDRRARSDWYIAHSFLIYKTENKTGINANKGSVTPIRRQHTSSPGSLRQ